MAKYITLSKEYRKRNIYVKNYINRQVYHSFLKDLRLSLPERQNIYQQFLKIRYSSSLVRLKNFCILTGHSRSVYRDIKLSRHKFNTMVLGGHLPGCI